jgi:ribonuclease D
LLQIASINPKTVEELVQVRGALRHLSADSAKSLIAALDEARALPKDDHPRDEKRKKQLSSEQDVIVDVLRMLLKLQSDKHHVAAKLIANKESLAALVMGKSGDDVPFLHGWRYEIFGQLAQDFITGRLQLRVDAQGGVLFEKGST